MVVRLKIVVVVDGRLGYGPPLCSDLTQCLWCVTAGALLAVRGCPIVAVVAWCSGDARHDRLVLCRLHDRSVGSSTRACALIW